MNESMPTSAPEMPLEPAPRATLTQSAARVATAFAGLIRTANVLIWSCVGVVALGSVGYVFLGHPAPARFVARPAPVRLDVARRQELDLEVRKILAAARKETEAEARWRVKAIVDQMKARVEPDFLDGYFGYMNQQKLGLNSLWFGLRKRLDIAQPSAQEQLAEAFRSEFASRVVKPEIAALLLRRVNERAVDEYVSRVRERVAGLPGKYNVPQPEWERYLDSIGTLGARPEANRQVPLSLKALVVGATPGVIWAGVRLVRLAEFASVRLSGVAAAEVAGGLALRAGGAVAARAGGRLLGPAIGLAILAWDAVDHQTTVATQEPLLARSLHEYLDAMGEDLVTAPGSGVMSAIDELEAALVKSLSRDRPV